MDNFDKLIGVLIIATAIMFFVLGATNPIVKDIEYINDTIYISVTDSSLMEEIDSLYCKIDSIECLNSMYQDELNVAIFKLERIRYYNDIAKNGNNIKYLRGWINRTLNE